MVRINSTFSNKLYLNRHNIFTNEMLIELEAKTRELSDKWGVSILEFNGEKDHVHLLIEMNPSIQPSKFIGNLKTVTSRHMRKVYGEYLRQFYLETNAMWSRAYCLISAEGAPISVLREYIENQGKIPINQIFADMDSKKGLVSYYQP